MKYVLVLLVSFGLFSCNTTKAVKEYDQVEETANDGKLLGVIRISGKGCSPIIEATENGELIKMYPVNLDESLKTDGLKIKFNYLPSKAMQPENCVIQLRVISVENVEPYK